MHSGGTWRLGRRPGLDGLRGVAVLLVVAFHVLGARFPGGGLVGVTLFFVLSGFLITSLLIDERESSGRVSYAGFYLRRAARLFPALVVMLLVVGPLAIGADLLAPSDVGAVALYSANWWAASGHPLGMLAHTWTLAAEEQFYLVWPVALALLSRSRHARVVVTAAAVLLAATRLTSLDGFAFATGADALLAGCALALWLRGRTVPTPPRWALPMLLVLLIGLCGLDATSAVVPVLTGASVLTVLALVTSSLDVSVFSWEPLRAVGRRSYGLYLWHLPILSLALASDLSHTAALAVGLVVLAAVTEASWRYVEQPFLRASRNDRDHELLVGGERRRHAHTRR